MKLKKILLEQKNQRDKISDKSLADHFRNYLRSSYMYTATDLYTPKYLENNPNDWDDLDKYWQSNDIFQNYAQDPKGWQDYEKEGGSVSNAELKKELKNTQQSLNIEESSWMWWIIGAILVLSGFAALRAWFLKKGFKFKRGKGGKIIPTEGMTQTLSNQTLMNVPEGQLFNWVQQQQKAAIMGSKQKLPKWAYDDLIENLAKTEVKREIREMVIATCINKIEAGTMNAKLFVKKLPANLAVKYGPRIIQMGEKAAKSRAAAKLRNEPQRRPPGM